VPVIRIDDPADARLEDYRNVPDPELIERRGIFVAEGRLVVARLLEDNRFRARSVLVTETALRAMNEVLDSGLDPAATSEAGAGSAADGAAPPLPVYVVPQWIINAITGFNIHRGCLAIGERTATPSWHEVARRARSMVVAERVANADNVGAIFRHAAAFGVDGVLLAPGCTDPLYRKAIRTSIGATLHVPFARMEPWPSALGDLRAQGWSLVALAPSADTRLQDAVTDARLTRKIAIVLGHEGDGLTREALEACDIHARIPMADGVDSVNVAAACAIALYELNRDRV
jgi:tRNA G18 (ribose-2'-O)-methylase SpoU